MSRGARTVYKYAEILADTVTLDLPVGARVLRVETARHRTQARDALVFWAQVDRDVPTERRTFRVFGTGHDMPDDVALEHVATVMDGPFVWHVFEEIS